jgi:hypothetical protein
MPIRPLLEAEPTAFGPDEIEAIAAAFEQTLHELRLVERRDPAVLMVARRIMDFANEAKETRHGYARQSSAL